MHSLLIFVQLMLAVQLIHPTMAATLTVCASGCDYTTLGGAFGAITSGETTTIDVAAGTYNENYTVVSDPVILNVAAGGITVKWTSSKFGYFHWLSVNAALTIQGGPLTLVDAGIEVPSFKGPFNLMSPLTITNVSSGVSLGDNVVFNQNGALNVRLIGHSRASCAVAVYNGQWNQQADTHVDCAQLMCFALSVQYNSKWAQVGSVTIENVGSSSMALYVYQNTTWTQEGDVSVQSYDGAAVYLYEGSKWNQTGSVTLQLGVDTQGSLSPPMQSFLAHACVACVECNVHVGVTLQNSQWWQSGQVAITGINNAEAGKTGVYLTQGAVWTQTGATVIDIGHQSDGVVLSFDASWVQAGDLTITLGQYSRGVNFYTSHLRSSWQVGSTVSIAVALSGSGVYNTLSANGSLSVIGGGSLFASAVNDSCAIDYPPLLECTYCLGAYNVTLMAGNNVAYAGCVRSSPTATPSPSPSRGAVAPTRTAAPENGAASAYNMGVVTLCRLAHQWLFQ